MRNFFCVQSMHFAFSSWCDLNKKSCVYRKYYHNVMVETIEHCLVLPSSLTLNAIKSHTRYYGHCVCRSILDIPVRESVCGLKIINVK